jgi:hypothetical protein
MEDRPSELDSLGKGIKKKIRYGWHAKVSISLWFPPAEAFQSKDRIKDIEKPPPPESFRRRVSKFALCKKHAICVINFFQIFTISYEKVHPWTKKI